MSLFHAGASMKFRCCASFSRFKSVVAPRRPHLVNGFVYRVASEKIGSTNPLLELLRIPRDAYTYHPDEHSRCSSALIYDSATVRYAALALLHLVANGLTGAYAHLNRLLDILVSSREELLSLDFRILRDILAACETIRHDQPRSWLRSMPHSGSTRIFNAVMEKSLACVRYICESAGSVSGPQNLADFASVMSRMGMRCDAFTKRLLQEMVDDAASCSAESLMGALEYLMGEVRLDVRGCMGAVYSIVDALAESTLDWRLSMRLLDCMAQLKVTHSEFVESITASLVNNVAGPQGDVIGMDTVSSRDLCRLLGALLEMEYMDVEAIMDKFLGRYIPVHRGKLKQGVIYRDIGKCTLRELVTLLNAILQAHPTVEGAANTWCKYIVQQKVPFKLSLTPPEDIKILLQSLSSLDPEIYSDVLRPPRDARWVYGAGKVNVTTLLSSSASLLGPHALANAVLCYSVSGNTLTDDATHKVVLKCIHVMCSDTLVMLLGSSLITRKTIEQLLSVEGGGALIVVGSSGSLPSPMIEAITGDYKSRFLYDPSLNANFKYLKRGDNRPKSSKALSKRFGWPKDSTPNEMVKSDHINPKDSIDVADNSGDGCLIPDAIAREPAAKLLKVLRHVYRSLCMFHHLGGACSVGLYDGLSLAGLQTVHGFLKVYDHVLTLLSTRFSSLDAESTMFGMDKSFESRLKKALRTQGTDYLDPRFMCTPDVYAFHKSQECSQRRLNFAEARLRGSSIGALKPAKSRVRLNWSHFYASDEVCPDVRARGPRKAAVAVQGEVARVSHEVDNRVNGEREVVEYYDTFVSRHFKDGFAYLSNSRGASGSDTSPCRVAGLSSSRLHKEVLQVAVANGLDPVPEFRCGPYYVDMHCARPRSAGGPARVTPVRREGVGI